MMDILAIFIAVVAIFFILKIAFKVLKFVLTLGVIALLLYYLMQFGFLSWLLF